MADSNGVLEALRTLTESLQEQYALTDEQIQEALFTQTIPATIFRHDATPLESVISFLTSKGRSATQIAKTLRRNKAYIEKVLARGVRHKDPEETQWHIPLKILATASAGKAITLYLAGKNLSNKEIAKILCKDESTIWTWKKRGEEQ